MAGGGCIPLILPQIRRQGGGPNGGCLPPIDMLSTSINKLTHLKTVAFVLNFKLWPPLINAWSP